MKEYSYIYQPRNILSYLGLFLLFGYLAYLLWEKSKYKYFTIRTKSMVIEPGSSHIILYILIAILVLGAIWFSVIMFSTTIEKYVVLNEQGIKVPNSMFRKSTIFIPFDAILDVKIVAHKNTETMRLTTTKGKFKLHELWFPSSDDYMKLSKSITRRKLVG